VLENDQSSAARGGRAAAVPELSVVVPCHNEARTLRELVTRLRSVLDGRVDDLEILLVDDGSTDDTLATMRSLSAPGVSYISLSRNFGKEAAMYAGLQHARGVSVVLMDGDLQHPPEIVPQLIEAYHRTGADQVIARRNRGGDPWLRRAASTLYYRSMSRFMAVRLVDGEGDFRLLSRRAVDALLSLTESTRFSKGLFAWIGFPVAVVDYDNASRAVGSSSWTFAGLVSYGMDGVLSFNMRPLRSMVRAGLVIVVLFVLYVLWVVLDAVLVGVVTPGYITIVAAIVLLGGVQLLCIGVIGEYVGRIFLETKHRPHYLVAETGDCDARPPIISSSANTGSGSIKSTSAGIRSRRRPGSPGDG
jgi:polyisoprenyl-phosphate glycosyltransferase